MRWLTIRGVSGVAQSRVETVEPERRLPPEYIANEAERARDARLPVHPAELMDAGLRLAAEARGGRIGSKKELLPQPRACTSRLWCIDLAEERPLTKSGGLVE